MKRGIFFSVIVLTGLWIVSLTGVTLQAAIPASERAALIAFYNATNGDSWNDNSNWKGINNEADGFSEIGSEGTWYGILVSGDHVIDIWLSYNNLSGGIPPGLANLDNLTGLDLGGNQLSGSIPPELGNLSNLTWLDLTYNQLNGSIPPELGNLNNLEYLELDGNQLSGSIPPELGNLSNLIWLDLAYNQLNGSIPPELGNLSNLTWLHLDDNQLNGSIPPELGNLNNLENLLLYYNQLSGSIPPELGNISSLMALELSYNQLSGNIPTNLSNLTNLYYLGIWYNCLYTNDTDLRAWLNSLDPDWESYQCIEDINPPFGNFETPIDGSTVSGSIAVTGWALDDSGIESVKIYREQGNDLVYIGKGVFVEGARPDVAAAYPDYPNNNRAGWGYMLLTHFLPDKGNGTFVIHAIAADIFGKTTTLGTKTIYGDNANSVKPFGAIDTPIPGGFIRGDSFVNWGWVLTPQPNSIPFNGSTINVWVDGVNIGHPTYNIYRSDIAGLFPGYANSDGAAGFFKLDTTAYANGVHTIQWTVTDSGGNTDGIGSRYFSINNPQGNSMALAQRVGEEEVSQLPEDNWTPIRVKQGFKANIPPQEVLREKNGMNRIVGKELGRIQVHLSDLPSNNITYSGYMKVGHCLMPLPVGSTLDAERGIFYWLPGPGFLGRYHLVFVETSANGTKMKKNIIVEIVPETALTDTYAR